jgi:alginate O-acetyltransferase complex protein AlgI
MLLFYLIAGLLAAAASRIAGRAYRHAVPFLFSLIFIFTLRPGDWMPLLITFFSTWLWGKGLSGRPMALGMAIACQIGILVSFKYLIPPGEKSLSGISGVPLGLSFYSLTAISYMTEVYYRNLQPLTARGLFLYLFFFVKLPQGPLVPPLDHGEPGELTEEDIRFALLKILSGLFRKLVIADRLAPCVNTVFDEPHGNYGLTLLLASYLFTFQLYFDFSGYTNVALGLARLLGFRLGENFRSPFLSSSVTEFWRRWHITLVEWLNTYIYAPLSYRLRSAGKKGIIVAVLVTFLVSGLWHGWGLTFVAWSLAHAFFVSAETAMGVREPRSQGERGVRIFLTFHVVCLANIFFRSSDFASAMHFFRAIFTPGFFLPDDLAAELAAVLAGGGEWENTLNLALTGLLLVFALFADRFLSGRKGLVLRAAFLVLLILQTGSFNERAPFIYRMF